MKTFEDLPVYQKAKDLCISIYKFENDKYRKDFGFKDQIQRASISVLNNIAEGFERRGDKELKNFLFIAKGSCAEVRSMLYIALELGYINKNDFNNLYNLTTEISKMLSGFIKALYQ